MILTLNQILKIFSDFATAHDQINDYGYGDASEIGTSRQMKFPYMWVFDDTVSIPTIHQTKNQTNEIGFFINFLDQENDQENFDSNVGFNSDNRQEIMSDTLQLCQDFVTFIQLEGHTWGLSIVDGSVSIDNTYDETTDKVYGRSMSITLRVKHVNCDLPGDFTGINPFPPCPPTPCDPATVQNSDLTYDTTVASGGTLPLPDIDITLNSGVFLTIPSVKNQDVELVDQTDTPIVPDSVVGNKITVTTGGGTCNSAEPLRSGQVTSYAANDDGALQNGRDTNFTTLEYNNPFGNLNRFTDESGGQTFTNQVYIDWTTYNTNTDKVIGYIISTQQGAAVTTWTNAMANQPYTYHGYSDWYCANVRECHNIINWGVNALLDYAPINYPIVNAATVLWTSTTVFTPTSLAWYLGSTRDVIKGNKGANAGYILVRYYTLTELGL